MMTLKPYTVVQLLSDQYSDRGVSVGAVGTILEVYGNEAYEVEFSRDDGTTIFPQRSQCNLCWWNLISRSQKGLIRKSCFGRE
jgi:Domain of unknown function (DUF4926)